MARMRKKASDANFGLKPCEHPRQSKVHGASGRLIGYQCTLCKAPTGGVGEPKPLAKIAIVSHVFPGFEKYMGKKDLKKAGIKS